MTSDPKTPFEVKVEEMRDLLECEGYKVDLERIFGHYTANGETWNQRGLAIKVFPRKDRP